MTAFELIALLTLNKKDYDKGLGDAEKETKNFGGKLKNFLGSAAKTTATAVATAGAAAFTGLAKLTQAAVESYAEYEQLVGGVNKLFGDSSAKVQAYADQAYATAGLSANAYMETVTSFSASLVSSLGGDTSKAADYANMAIKDMSDNANTFGTDIGMLQNAYQGFAKQNYTMLDNLNILGASVA